jgi:DnaK suppressor protein
VYQGEVVDEATRAALNEQRVETLARIERLSAEYDGIVAASADTNADDEHDPEGPTIAFERAQVGSLLAQSRAYLHELDQADARLAAGRYGWCERCGEPIGAERLAARPAVTTCIRCAAR